MVFRLIDFHNIQCSTTNPTMRQLSKLRTSYFGVLFPKRKKQNSYAIPLSILRDKKVFSSSWRIGFKVYI